MKLRFAPSPTGYLHVGNARIAVANALCAARAGGSLLLRLDDTDRERSRPEYAAAIEEDLAWLGISWSAFLRQSDRLARYGEVAERLKREGRLYPCFETEAELKAKREARLRRGLPPLYDRAMLKLTAEQREAALAGGKTPHWRFRLSDGDAAWQDRVLGPRRIHLAHVSDPVLIRADGTPLYTFTSVVDDIDTGITDIVRGEDHVTNTGVQIDIFRALGSDMPHFAHLPLLVDADGGKLSKRLEGLSLRALRQDGIEPEAVAGYLARLGTADAPEPAPLAVLAEGFAWEKISHSPPRFDMRQLLALNRRALHAAPFERVRARLPEDATETFWQAVRGNLDMLVEARRWWEVAAGSIVPPVIEGEGTFLNTALETLPPEPWTEKSWSEWTRALGEATGRRGKTLFMPLRLALTGETEGPELAKMLPLMGRERVAGRLATAVR